MTDHTQLNVRIPEHLKAHVDADQRPNQEVVEAALWREFGGEKQAKVDRRIEELERRIDTVTEEKRHRREELDELRDELAKYRERREELDAIENQYVRNLAENLEFLPAADNLAVQNHAEKANMEPEAFHEKLKEYMENDE